MALIYLRHPLHGEKAESNDLISYLDKKAGWVEFDPVQEAADRVVVEPEDEKPNVKKVVGTVATSKVETVVPDFLKGNQPKQ